MVLTNYFIVDIGSGFDRYLKSGRAALHENFIVGSSHYHFGVGPTGAVEFGWETEADIKIVAILGILRHTGLLLYTRKVSYFTAGKMAYNG